MIEILEGDCLELMRDIPDGSVDMILCDLPYGTTACKWDTVIPFEPLWAHYKRIIKRNGAVVLTASQPFTSALVISNSDWFRYELIWDKKLSTGFLDANRKPLKRHESVLIFAEGRTTYNPQMRTGRYQKKGNSGPSECYGQFKRVSRISDQYYPTSIIEVSNAHQSAKVHPTQKPVALFEYLIRTYTNPGELVLDNAAGSGTTGIAALNTGRQAILIEREPQYVQTIKNRLSDAHTRAA